MTALVLVVLIATWVVFALLVSYWVMRIEHRNLGALDGGYMLFITFTSLLVWPLMVMIFGLFELARVIKERDTPVTDRIIDWVNEKVSK